MTSKARINLCSGCFRRAGLLETSTLEDQIKAIENSLKEENLGQEFEIKTYSCFRFCPPNRISVEVLGRLNMSRSVDTESIVQVIRDAYKSK